MNEFAKLIAQKKVLIFGLGRQGGGTGDMDWLKKNHAIVRVSDSDLSLREEGQTKEQIDWADLIIKNPGVRDDHDLILYAKSLNKPVLTSIAVFVKYTTLTTIGVTGTRGKSTTVALIKAILENAFPGQVIAGGNIAGTSGLSLFNLESSKQYAVLELSSFQLHNFHDLKISPKFAVVTNLYPDHLNRYLSMQDYLFDKQAICQYQAVTDSCLYNVDNSGATQIAQASPAKKIPYSAKDYADWETSLPGIHNQENIAAASTLAKTLGIDESIISQTVKSFTGLPYRLEVVAQVGGVKYVNDTTSTTPTAAIKALASLTSPTIWITGGDTKNLPFEELLNASSINTQLKAVVILGSKNIPTYVSGLKKILGEKILGQVDSMAQALKLANSHAVSGDTVLLSPGFASFDLFKNEFDRGDQFNALVQALSDRS